MFKFLKRLFQEKEAEETIKTDNLLFWFDNKVNEKLKYLDNDIKLLLDGIENRKNILKERIKNLEQAEIKDPEKIESKIKNIVIGHRDNYARALNIFLNELILPEDKTAGQATKFNDLLKEKLDSLGKTTAKSYAASQHLFFNEVQEITKALKDMADLSKNFEKVIEKNKLKETEMIRMMVEMLNKKISEKERIKEALGLKKSNLEELWTNKKKRIDEIDHLEKGEDYQNYLALKEKKESIESQIRENQSKFLQVFAQLERSLRKYEHMAAENLNLIREYLENPIETFFKDKDLIFIKILEGIKKNLESGIDLKESKMEKTIEVINKVTEEDLKKIKQAHHQLMDEKSIVSKKIDNSHVYMKLSDLKYRLEHLDTQIADLEQEIRELEELLQKTDLEKIKEAIKEKVFEVFRVKLTIS